MEKNIGSGEGRLAGFFSGLSQNDKATRPVIGEMLSQKGAMALAKRLEQYWHGRGYLAARFWAEPIGERFDKVGTYEIYRVVSNLVNGLPPRYLDNPMPPPRNFKEYLGTQA
ncbi:MAG: hypothetical protein HY053_03560 [Proteobacteria bacterium]|nr:hypothetical protein [Pseudomonadota bacterium]